MPDDDNVTRRINASLTDMWQGEASSMYSVEHRITLVHFFSRNNYYNDLNLLIMCIIYKINLL